MSHRIMSQITIIPIPAFNDNYIWAFHAQDSSHIYVVDPGDAAPVNQFLSANDYQLAGILITHHHYDHTGGIASLTTTSNVPVYGPDNPNIQGITHSLKDGDVIKLAGTSINIIATPGHTLDHISYMTNHTPSPALFCGDILFSAGCGRLFEGTAEQMHDSLSRLSALPADTQIYPAHEYTQSNLKFAHAVEPNNLHIAERIQQVNELRQKNQPTVPSTLATEQLTNPFLRTGQPDVIAAAKKRAQTDSVTPVDVLRKIREWKDQF